MRQCSGKMQYSMVDAKANASAMQTIGENVNVYQCPICHKWHIGHKTERRNPQEKITLPRTYNLYAGIRVVRKLK